MQPSSSPGRESPSRFRSLSVGLALIAAVLFGPLLVWAAVDTITLPTLPGYGPSGEAAVTRTLEICRERIAMFA